MYIKKNCLEHLTVTAHRVHSYIQVHELHTVVCLLTAATIENTNDVRVSRSRCVDVFVVNHQKNIDYA